MAYPVDGLSAGESILLVSNVATRRNVLFLVVERPLRQEDILQLIALVD